MIEGHAFFAGVDWKAVEERKLEPPLKPDGVGRDTSNFDPAITALPAVVSL